VLASWLALILLALPASADDDVGTSDEAPAVAAEEESEPPPVPEPEAQPDPEPDPVGLPTGLIADQPAPPLIQAVQVVGPRRAAHDLVVFVRADGQLYLGDDLLRDQDLPAVLADRLQEDPETRVVVETDEGAPSGRVREVLQRIHEAGATRVALDFSDVELGSAQDRLFVGGIEELGDAGVEELGSELSRRELRKLKPKRWKFPQNPYGAIDFTSYTLEWGEARLGLLNIYYGVLPRTQIGTCPLLDGFGVYNVNGKINAIREGRLDMAVLGSATYVPMGELMNWADQTLGLGLSGDAGGQQLFTSQITVFSLGGMASLRLANPWTLHAGLRWSRVGARGELDFGDLPEVLIPGETDDEAYLVSSLAGELLTLKLATDIRFNRRDSLVLQLRAPVYARARGAISGQIDGLQNLENLELLVSYGDALPLATAYQASLSYQLQWKHWQARAGLGTSAIEGAWLMQAFDLSYRFGGKTRREESQIRKGYRRNRRSEEQGA